LGLPKSLAESHLGTNSAGTVARFDAPVSETSGSATNDKAGQKLVLSGIVVFPCTILPQSNRLNTAIERNLPV
jgi:hypothetical protein